ncbi:hypothetical protein CEXT_100841 [Caerostris extrusa]|uniref:Uncharacterized protein n=1 Tax=Caerostris extrusa TaxID=172846 RepID=A0AAV4MEG2_CAEEX|nr:hypothetical protein CEXT_100841 [Caerostris extrusa]
MAQPKLNDISDARPEAVAYGWLYQNCSCPVQVRRVAVVRIYGCAAILSAESVSSNRPPAIMTRVWLSSPPPVSPSLILALEILGKHIAIQ